MLGQKLEHLNLGASVGCLGAVKMDLEIPGALNLSLDRG
jgi:hypothetical protein